MLTPEQIATAKLVWENNLRLKVEKWKADANAYINNKVSLALDDVVDVAKLKWVSSPFPAKKEHQLQELFLDKQGNLPLDFQLHLGVVQALAAENGIDIRSDIDFEDDKVIVFWNVVSIDEKGAKFLENFQSRPITTTNSKILAEIEEEVKNPTLVAVEEDEE